VVLANSRRRFKKVAILEIRAFPEPGDPKNIAQINQIFAPATAVLNVRTASQLLRNDTEIQLLKNEYPGLIEHVTFEASTIGPLSWMLSQSEKNQIEGDWKKASKSADMNKLVNIY
jgi:hypothetical protein